MLTDEGRWHGGIRAANRVASSHPSKVLDQIGRRVFSTNACYQTRTTLSHTLHLLVATQRMSGLTRGVSQVMAASASDLPLARGKVQLLTTLGTLRAVKPPAHSPEMGMGDLDRHHLYPGSLCQVEGYLKRLPIPWC
jgi:hypothetical protein